MYNHAAQSSGVRSCRARSAQHQLTGLEAANEACQVGFFSSPLATTACIGPQSIQLYNITFYAPAPARTRRAVTEPCPWYLKSRRLS